jgi:AcrR family transcriptional regulator
VAVNGKKEIEINPSTEEKIKEAAREVFTRKGYAATRTRDIAEESGYNLALINYYFRSKEKLFEIIVLEQMQLFVHSVMGIVNDEQTSLKEKIEILIGHYIDMIIRHPHLPAFILGEINANPGQLAGKLGFTGNPHDLYLVKQWKELKKGKKELKFDPMHIVLNVLSMTIFPFVASPLFRNRTGMNLETFNNRMQERKKLIPLWIAGMINS